MDGKSDGVIELSDISSKQKNDATDMARLGKLPVLKVLRVHPAARLLP